MSDQHTYRRLRIIEYVGTQDWVDSAINNRSVKGRATFGGGVIREALLGETSELLQNEPESNPNDRPRSGTALEHTLRPGRVEELPIRTGQTVKWSRPGMLSPIDPLIRYRPTE